jgi:hypothetical protein
VAAADVERRAACVVQAERSRMFHFFPGEKKMGAGGSNRGGRSVVVGGWLRREGWRDETEGAW